MILLSSGVLKHTARTVQILQQIKRLKMYGDGLQIARVWHLTTPDANNFMFNKLRPIINNSQE